MSFGEAVVGAVKAGEAKVGDAAKVAAAGASGATELTAVAGDEAMKAGAL